jgi:hypothetical protein
MLVLADRRMLPHACVWRRCARSWQVAALTALIGIVGLNSSLAQEPWSATRQRQSSWLQTPSTIREQPESVAPGHYLQVSTQDLMNPVPPYDPNERRIALAPHGYPSSYPGDVTDEGAPLGGQSAPNYAPQYEPPPAMIGQPIFDGMFNEPNAPEAVVYPNGVVIHEPDDLPVSVNGLPPGNKRICRISPMMAFKLSIWKTVLRSVCPFRIANPRC